MRFKRGEPSAEEKVNACLSLHTTQRKPSVWQGCSAKAQRLRQLWPAENSHSCLHPPIYNCLFPFTVFSFPLHTVMAQSLAAVLSLCWSPCVGGRVGGEPSTDTGVSSQALWKVAVFSLRSPSNKLGFKLWFLLSSCIKTFNNELSSYEAKKQEEGPISPKSVLVSPFPRWGVVSLFCTILSFNIGSHNARERSHVKLHTCWLLAETHWWLLVVKILVHTNSTALLKRHQYFTSSLTWTWPFV